MAPIRIRTLLALTMGGLVLVASAAVLTIGLVANARNTFTLLNDRVVLIVDGIEAEVRGRFGAASDLVNGLAREVKSGNLRDASPDEIHAALEVALATTPKVEVLLAWNRALTRRLVFRDADGNMTREGPEAEANQHIRQALAVLPPGARQWGDPVVENGITYLNYAANVGSDAPNVAYLVAAVSLESFSEVVARVGRNYGATAFILYGNDDVLAHPSFVGRGTAESGHAVVPIAEAGDPVLANLWGGEPVSFLGSARRAYVETSRVRVDGATYLVMYRLVYGFGGQPLVVGAYVPRAVISETLQRIGVSGVAGLLVTILGVATAIMLGGLIVRPVRRLAASASAVARLDLAAVERPPASPIAEVNEQARAFDLMLDALQVFQTYVPRKLVQRLIALAGKEGMPSETRELTVLFTDMVHFSEISERMGAEETASFLNRHFGILAECIEVENGTIDKYIGDAVMAYWGAPDRMDDHTARAVSAARRIAETLTADNQRRARKGLRPVRVRIGIHSGVVLVGNIGAPERVNYTLVGDAVNDAERLEELGRQLDAGADVTVLMSATTARLAGLGEDETEDVGAHRLAGGHEEVAVRRLKA